METIYFDWPTGQTIYAKLSPLDTGTWSTGVTAMSENGSTGEYSASVAVGRYAIYLQDGGSPASSDTRIGYEVVDDISNRTLFQTIESQRGAHTASANVYYVDPANGDTHANGNRGGWSDPYDSVQDCHDNAVTDSNHDLIILVSGASGGATTLTEDVTLSKRYLFIRGPGRDFIWTRSGAGDTISITADGIELSGFQVNTAATGSGNGITVTSADFFKASRLWLNDTQGDAIELTDCDNFVIDGCTLQGSGQSGSGHGIQVLAGSGQTSDYGLISHCYIFDVQGDGIQMDTTGGGSNASVMINHNHISGCTDDGIDIVDSGSVGTVIDNNIFGNNTGNDIEDSGTNTIIASTVEANLTQILGTAIAESTPGDIAAAWSGLYDIPGNVITYIGLEVDSQLSSSHSNGSWSAITAAGVRTAIGMAAADLDTQLDAISQSVSTGAIRSAF